MTASPPNRALKLTPFPACLAPAMLRFTATQDSAGLLRTRAQLSACVSGT